MTGGSAIKKLKLEYKLLKLIKDDKLSLNEHISYNAVEKILDTLISDS